MFVIVDFKKQISFLRYAYSLTTSARRRKKKFHMGVLVNYYRPITSQAVVAKEKWIISVLKNDFQGALIGVPKP